MVNADDKKRARLNLVHHLPSLIPYQDLTPQPIVLRPAPAGRWVYPPTHHRPDVRAGGVLTNAGLTGSENGVSSTFRGLARPWHRDGPSCVT